MEDEYLITLAMMHGCAFHCHAPTMWYAIGDNTIHPVEHRNYLKTGIHHWSSREELARDYCKFYKLGTYGGNNEKVNSVCATRPLHAG